MNRHTRALGLMAVGCALWALPVPALADYPDRPIRLFVPQAAGSATDTVARILAAEMAPILGGTIIVEDKPGGALTLGMDYVAKSAPDGYTLAIGPIGALALTRHRGAKSPYKMQKEIQT